MSFQNYVGVKKAFIDSPFDDDEPEEHIPFANLIEALGGPEEAFRPEPFFYDPIYHGEVTPTGAQHTPNITPAEIPTSMLTGIVDAYQNREALGDEANRHQQMSNFMAKLTGMQPLDEDSFIDADEVMPSIDDATGRQEYDDITAELGLRRKELEEARQNVPGLYQPLRSEDMHELSGPAVPTINTPDDIILDDWLRPEEQELLLSEPMDLSWRLLKFIPRAAAALARGAKGKKYFSRQRHLPGRQATLPEFSENMTSPHGPVRYFHGTTGDNVSNIQIEGLRANSGSLPHQRASSGFSSPQSEGKVAWVTPHKGMADSYAVGNAMRNASRPHQPAQIGVNWGSHAAAQNPVTFGVREAAGVPTNTMGGMAYYNQPIAPEHLVRLSEPMSIAYQLLKERVSPAAIRHKLEYDTNYESSPKRVKYREKLNQERRKRGIYGSGNQMDVSHTQGGKLTLEGQHANRARHFKNRGTLRRVNVR